MRIISGLFKGKKILEPKDHQTRPLKDLTKESIFNILKHSNKFQVVLKDAIILDLFSGVGSFGLECLSRQASFVTFIENYKRVLPILEKNILNLNCLDKSKIIKKDIFKHINFNSFNQKFNIIFMDPPYKEKKINDLIETILNREILKKKGIIVIHRHKNDIIKISKKLKILDERIYGISKITIGN